MVEGGLGFLYPSAISMRSVENELIGKGLDGEEGVDTFSRRVLRLTSSTHFEFSSNLIVASEVEEYRQFRCCDDS